MAGNPAVGQVRMPQFGNGKQTLVLAADCPATKGTTSYDFAAAANIEMVPNRATFTSSTWTFEARDARPDENIPDEAKNNVNVKLKKADDSATLASWSSPDNYWYFNGEQETIYGFAPNWNLPLAAGNVMKIEYIAYFDKRGVTDAYCEAETVPFHGARGQGVEVN